VVLGLLVATVLAGCSTSSTGPSSVNSTTGGATFDMVVRPNPVTATHCSPQCGADVSGSFAFSASMTVDVRNSSSVAGTINSMTLTGTADGTTFAPLTFSSDDISGQAGTTHIDPHATLSVPVAILYNTPSGKANLNISVSLQITDAGNKQVTASGQVNVI
jgi:hypothetical protein